MDVSSSSSSPSHVLYRWGSDFVSRPEVRSPKATSPPVDFALPLKPSAEFPYAPLTPRSLDYVNDPILSPLSLLSLTAVGPHGRMHLAEDIIVQWIDLEFRLVAIREMLLRDVDQGTLPLRYRSCAVPTSYGYRKIYSTRRAVWRRAAHSRDAFAVLIGECHYLALMNGKLLDRSGRVHVSSLDIMLTSAGTFMHDVWLTTFVNIFDKPVAGFVASIADIENSFWLSRLPRTAPMYVWWGDSAQLSLHVKRGERLPALVVPCRPSSQDFARAEVASADTVVGTSGPPRFQSDGESDDAFMRRRQEWYTASAAVLLPTHGHVGVVQAFEWIKDSRGQMRREPIPPMFFHPAFEHYLDNEKIYDASRSEWDFCWAGYKKDVALFNQGLDEKGIGETGLADGMLPDAQVLRSAEEREASKAICAQNALERLSDDMAVALGARYGYFADSSAVVVDRPEQPSKRTIAWLMGEGLQSPTSRTLCCSVPDDVAGLRAALRVILSAAGGDDPPSFASSVIDTYRQSAWSVWTRQSSRAFRVCVAWDRTSVPVYVFKFSAAPPATQWLATYDAAVALMLQRIGSSCTTPVALFRMAMELGCPMLVLRDVAGSEEGEVGSSRGKGEARAMDDGPRARTMTSRVKREVGSVDDVRLGSKDTVHAEDDGPLRSGSLDGAVETTVPVILSAVPTPSAQSAASSSAGPSSTVLDADCRPSPDGAAEGSRPGGGSACDSGHRMGRRPDGAPPADASVATQGVSCQKSGGVDRKGKEPSSASPFGRATHVGEYLRQRRLHYTLERAAAAFKRGGILGRIARDLHPTDQMLSFVYGKPSPAKPLILCTFEDGTTVADEDITCEDLDILIGTYFVANNPVDRFNTKKVTFWPTEFIFNSKGPYCGVWTRDAEEWYLQRRDRVESRRRDTLWPRRTMES
ncbi:hypothetical protein EV122DRAFT_295577 [Schizophyllum commune]